MFERLPGFRDFYPEDCARRNHLFRVWSQTARRFGFLEYDIPTLEPLELFTEKSGPEIVTQLFNFEDKGGRQVALRPELTPSLARMVGARANSLRRPVKWFNVAENFRYEKPQKGRLRSHYQFNADIFGEAGAGADAELITLCLESLRAFGLGENDLVLRLSDRTLWIDYLAALGHTGDAAMEILGVVDKRERMSTEEAARRLEPHFGSGAEAFLGQVEQLVRLRSVEELGDFLSAQAPDCGAKERIGERLREWERLISALEAFGMMPFVRIDLGIVRGLAYYTGFVFEIFELDADETVGRALAGGGRYDHLVGKLGFGALPAVGFGMGDVTVADLLEKKGLFPTILPGPDVYVVIAGEAEAPTAWADIAALRGAGRAVEYPLKAVGFGKQFKLAGQSGARLALIYGAEEVAHASVKIKDLRSGGETTVARPSLLAAVQGILEDGLPPVGP